MTEPVAPTTPAELGWYLVYTPDWLRRQAQHLDVTAWAQWTGTEWLFAGAGPVDRSSHIVTVGQGRRR